jgi:hypothetical protein
LTRQPDDIPLFTGDGSGRLPLVYVASPLSSLTVSEQRQIDAWCKNIEDAILNERTGAHEWTLRTHIPAQQSPPWKADNRSAGDVYRLNSGLVWSDVDALMVLCPRGGSLGAGMELAWAVGLGVPCLVVHCATETPSRQVLGLCEESDLRVEPFEDANKLQSIVRHWLNAKRPELDARDLRRQIHRQRTQSLRGQLQARWDSLDTEGRERAAMDGGFTVARMERLVGSASALVAATLHELLTLTATLGVELGAPLSPRGSALSPSQLRALSQAATEYGWGPGEAVELVQRAQAELSSTAVRRLPLASPEDWRRFKEAHGG